MKILFILGASDPEMEYVEKLTWYSNQRVVYASANGKRVHPGNAYKAQDTIGNSTGIFNKVVFVECGFVDSVPNPDDNLIIVDHHRPGDPGYNKPPKEFMQSSSIGQVISILAYNNLLPNDFSYRNIGEGFWRFPLAGKIFFSGYEDWNVCSSSKKYTIPKEYVQAAAADHCLGAAYQGLCPGVDPDELMDWRVEVKAKFQNKPKHELISNIENAMSSIMLSITKNRYDENGIIDMIGEIIPELPEAACRMGVTVMAGPLDSPDGRKKIVLQNASSEIISKFLSGDGFPEIIDRYGDPERGFAGGYLS